MISLNSDVQLREEKNWGIFRKAAAKENEFVQIGYRGRQQAALSGRTKLFKEE